MTGKPERTGSLLVADRSTRMSESLAAEEQ
jgi:hypothetical protein